MRHMLDFNLCLLIVCVMFIQSSSFLLQMQTTTKTESLTQ